MHERKETEKAGFDRSGMLVSSSLGAVEMEPESAAGDCGILTRIAGDGMAYQSAAFLVHHSHRGDSGVGLG